MDIGFDAIAGIILDDLAPGLRDHTVVLTRLLGFLFVVIVIRRKDRSVITGNAKPREQSGLCLARLCVHDLNDLIKTHGARTDIGEARQN